MLLDYRELYGQQEGFWQFMKLENGKRIELYSKNDILLCH